MKWLKKLFSPKKKKILRKAGCPHCGGQLKPAKADVSETYGRPVRVCTRCKRLIPIS